MDKYQEFLKKLEIKLKESHDLEVEKEQEKKRILFEDDELKSYSQKAFDEIKNNISDIPISNYFNFEFKYWVFTNRLVMSGYLMGQASIKIIPKIKIEKKLSDFSDRYESNVSTEIRQVDIYYKIIEDRDGYSFSIISDCQTTKSHLENTEKLIYSKSLPYNPKFKIGDWIHKLDLADVLNHYFI
jgi:hypothetical protein